MTQTEFKCGHYLIRSYGNGTAYEIVDGYRSLFVQGDEASQIREDTNQWELSSVLDDIFREYFTT